MKQELQPVCDSLAGESLQLDRAAQGGNDVISHVKPSFRSRVVSPGDHSASLDDCLQTCLPHGELKTQKAGPGK